jgi:hypothetical protein
MNRVLVVSDPAFPLSTSGFAMPCRAVVDGLLHAGFKVLHMARGARISKDDMPDAWAGKPIVVINTPSDDINGYRYLGYLIETESAFEPISAIVYIADPESIRSWRTNILARAISASKPMPTVTYGPTEGGPLMKPDSVCLAEIVACGGIVNTYTKFSANVMTEAIKAAIAKGEKCPDFEIGVIPHGTDHAAFRKLPTAQRQIIREKYGWSDKFVVMNVARNAGRKMWTNLFKAIALLVGKYPNVRLYAHTVPFEGFSLGGHNLAELAARLGITEHVIYPDRIPDPWHGVDFEKLISAYNAADLFVSPSGAEGWNLPVSESAACGTPVVCTAYSGMWEQAHEYAIPLHPDAWITHQSGAELAYIQPQQIANTIESCMVADLSRFSRLGMTISGSRSWDVLKDAIVESVQCVC